MAKKSILEREKKRQLLILKYVDKRHQLITNLRSSQTVEEFYQFNEQIQKLPRNSISIRSKNRCWKTGKAKSYYRYFGLCRNMLRELALNGMFPGIIKASW